MLNKKRKAVVTGGAGFIGSHVVDALVGEGFDVHVIDNLQNGRRENVNKDATLHEVDIRDLETTKSLIKGAEYVFHFAALPRVQYSIEHPVETNDINVNGTLNVLLAARDAGAKRLIYSASSSAYGEQDKLPLVETMSAEPISPYGLQKYIGELQCKMFSRVFDLPTVSLRYFNVYGPRLKADGAYSLVIGVFLVQKSEGKPLTITGDGTQTRDFTHVRDIVRANLLAMKSDKVGKGEVINIGAGKGQSINKLAELIGGQTKYIEARLEPHDGFADNTKAKKLLGWEPKEVFEDGIKELKKEAGL